ncbi:hypothetical protein H5410_052533 [Solanum commersonii]|uniref:Uncharacterized protein n=1 Tax=Solanum commersonii TaxID=4109 RepID=A0A9J5X1R1_SOLCO|nr:hypothetical protein H5410_052533 [Solanum commersonii]
MASTISPQHGKMFNKQENVITTLPTEQQVHDKEKQVTISHQTKQLTSLKQNQDGTWKEARNNSFGKLVQTILKNRIVPIANVFNPLVEEIILEMENEKSRMNQGQKANIGLIAIIENRVKEISSSRIVKKIAYGWKCSQYIHGIVKVYRDNMDFQFTAIYGLHNIKDGGVLWADLKGIDDQMLDPWLIVGDFNIILHIENRSNGDPV